MNASVAIQVLPEAKDDEGTDPCSGRGDRLYQKYRAELLCRPL